VNHRTIAPSHHRTVAASYHRAIALEESRNVTGPILGWDIGGANLKAARIADGQSEARVVERPFALWREPQRLPAMLTEIAEALGRAEVMAVTMTAELADCFATKREGVACVLDAFQDAFPDVDARIYGVDGRFRSLAAARHAPRQVAAANWRASAALVARTSPDALFIDVGSTTTDVIPLVGGRVVARGKTDPARLRTGELIYTGLLRTPICAIVRRLPLRGRWCRVAAEHFAVAADAHLWLGRIGADDYTCETPDGRGRSPSEAGARLARMVCADLDMLAPADITALAEHVARAQVRQIASGIRQVRRRLGAGGPRLAVVAGHGAVLAREAAQSLGLDVKDLRQEAGAAIARAAPAAAVAYLLAGIQPGSFINASSCRGPHS
jgi:probable H4MPT-linked C1 transfer pathway protein